jgi:hypothetical protein
MLPFYTNSPKLGNEVYLINIFGENVHVMITRVVRLVHILQLGLRCKSAEGNAESAAAVNHLRNVYSA